MTGRRKVGNYLKTIYLLQQNGSVRGTDIAKEFNVTRPAVAETLVSLMQEGYVEKKDDRSIALTPAGMAIALEILKRYHCIYEILVRLGVGEETAKKDADGLSYVMSDESFCAFIAASPSSLPTKQEVL